MTSKTNEPPLLPAQEKDIPDMDPRLAEFLRRAFWWLNRFMIFMWRLGLGIWLNDARTSGQIMVITHIGRKSGLRRQTPVNYAIVDGELYCLAGFGRTSDWYLNVRHYANLIRQVLIGSGFAALLAGINPRTMSDDELVAATRGYRLLHIRRTGATTGPGGPGDLAWVWPIATAFLLLLLWQPFRPIHANKPQGKSIQ
jgi:deazaflavin-dependent oxidoreductase (nitroreductase family)